MALTIDVGVPALFTAMIGAARVAAIRGGRLHVRENEAFHSGASGGGHTIERHVAQTEAQMRTRLERMVQEAAMKKTPGPASISSFRTLNEAERAVSRALSINAPKIKQWAKSAGEGGVKILVLNDDLGTVIGHGVVRATGKLQKMTAVRVVLRWQRFNGMPYYIVTAHPVP